MKDGNKAREKEGILATKVFALAVVFFLLISFFPTVASAQTREVNLNWVAQAIKAGEVKAITVQGNDLLISLSDGTTATSRKESGVSLLQTLRDLGVGEQELANVNISVQQSTDWSGVIGTLLWVVPVLILVILFFSLMRQPGTGGQAFTFGRSRAREITGNRPQVTFSDVAGVDEAKQELEEVVGFLKQPERFRALGARIPKGLLLIGPPGTGKTLLARAVAGEARVPFFSISGSEFVELFVGVGAARVRDLFDQAKRNSPCIVFIDEIDAVGRQRGTGLGGGHDEREQTLNQVLVEMDGFDQNTNIVVIAATNRPDILDPALTRPGRFDRRVALDIPDLRGRLAILTVHSKGKPLASDIDLERLARQTPGFSGADLENTMNEAALLAARRGKTKIGMAELEEAVDRVVLGPERRSRLLTPWEKKATAFHEAGHAVVAHALPDLDPLHKVSVVARGVSGGHTRLLPMEDRRLWRRSQLAAILTFAMGGLAAEELMLGETTTGPESDLEQATRMARKMVAEYGMSERLGPVVFGHREEFTFLGREVAEGRNYSDETAAAIDEETRRLIGEARNQAREIVARFREELERLAEALIEKETLQGEELESLLAGVRLESEQPRTEQGKGHELPRDVGEHRPAA